tara:strand:- start:715 stop:1578 length:864 start_codon:yes stop_codon:yes gene_type:complete
MSKDPTQREIPFINGLTVRPAFTSVDGDVTFTDGTNDLLPNQFQCEAYGYTYNKVTGACSIFRFNTNLELSFGNESNRTAGAGNSTELGTTNTIIMGENNTVKGLSRNSIITGNRNEIANGVNNANVSGTLGQATADNSKVLGTNAAADSLGKRQSIHLMYGVQTVTSGTIDSYLNNITGSYFAIPDNTIMYFHADIVAVRVGGTGTGNAGDFASFVERGVIINKSGVLSIARERDTIKSSGTVTLWRPTAAVSGTNFLVDIRGAADVTIEWAADIKFTQIKTGVTL